MIDLSRSEAIDCLSGRLSKVESVCSVSVVGSFRDGETTFSDIDVIVVVEENSWVVFRKLVNVIESIDGASLGFPDRNVKVNACLGPLKFDSENTIVVHLMVYSRAGHRKHVLDSPFTCFDWERYEANFGDALRNIFPVGALQLSDFVSARRGISDYLADIRNCAISYREFVPEGTKWIEVKKLWPLDARHQNEFSYHVVKFIVGNFLKWAVGENRRFSASEFHALWSKLLPGTKDFQVFFQKISNAKRDPGFEYPENTITHAESFLDSYSEEISLIQKRVTRIKIFRHARTELNDGRFLGQGTDPAILPMKGAEVEHGSPEKIFSSPLLRARQTAELLSNDKTPIIDRRLTEIDYGDCEGLTIGDLEAKFPEIVEAWKNGDDPRFPEGESQQDVLERVFQFLESVDEGRAVVVTHNVVIRCLLGSLLDIPRSRWFRIPVGHLEGYEIVKFNGNYSVNLDKEQRAVILDSVV